MVGLFCVFGKRGKNDVIVVVVVEFASASTLCEHLLYNGLGDCSIVHAWWSWPFKIAHKASQTIG